MRDLSKQSQVVHFGGWPHLWYHNVVIYQRITTFPVRDTGLWQIVFVLGIREHFWNLESLDNLGMARTVCILEKPAMIMDKALKTKTAMYGQVRWEEMLKAGELCPTFYFHQFHTSCGKAKDAPGLFPEYCNLCTHLSHCKNYMSEIQPAKKLFCGLCRLQSIVF